MSNREKLALVISEKMNTKRAKTAMEVMDSFDSYIVNQGLSGESLYEISSIIKISGLISRVKTDKCIKSEYKGKLFFLERGLFHYKNMLVEIQNQEEAESAWRELEFEPEYGSDISQQSEDKSNTTSDENTYDEQRINQMLNDPEGFIRSLAKSSRME